MFNIIIEFPNSSKLPQSPAKFRKVPAKFRKVQHSAPSQNSVFKVPKHMFLIKNVMALNTKSRFNDGEGTSSAKFRKVPQSSAKFRKAKREK